MLEVKDISIRLGDFALHGVSLSVERGDYCCLIGPTGAGKTILLECVAGLHKPESGTIRIEGTEITGWSPEERGVGYVPQDYALFPHMNVYENIAYGLVERATPTATIRKRVHEAAELLSIAHLMERRPFTLSGGEAQRVALARTLVLECDLLLLDEPFSALDDLTKRELLPYLRQIHTEMGLTVLHVTHDFDEALGLANQVGVICDGRMLQVGNLEEVFRHPKTRQIATFVGICNLWGPQDEAGEASELVAQMLERAPGRVNGRSICIRSDNVRVMCADEADGDFTAAGRVVDMRWLGPIYELTVDVGVPLVATISVQQKQRLGCSVGDRVALAVDADDVKAIEDA